MSFEIITDSCCNLTEDMIDELGIHILPLTFIIDGEEYQSYLKGEKTDLKQFFTMMREGKVITTSLPNIGDSEKLMRGLLDEGKDILFLGFSSALSGTYQATSVLMNQLAEQYPDRTLVAIDTLAASAGQGMVVYYAAQQRAEGKGLEEVASWVRENLPRAAHWFTVDDLMFLLRGGRVSKTAAIAGTVLNIKPVMHVDDEGKLIPVGKVRGRKKSIQALMKHMKETAQDVSDQTVFITHGDCIEDVEYLSSLIRAEYGEDTRIAVNYIDPVIGAHAGPGTLALFFMADKR